MSTTEEHIRQAEHNEALSRQCALHYPDWAVTALFYAALHWAEAYFSAESVSGEPSGYVTHAERSDAILRRISEEAYIQYRFLEEQSRNARYRCTRFSVNDVEIVRRQHYEPFREIVKAKLSSR